MPFSSIYSLGVMTGTSCDGADCAILRLTQDKKGWHEKLIATASTSFPIALRKKLRDAQSGKITIRESSFLTREYSQWLGKVCARVLQKFHLSNRKNVLVAVHGQTLWHEPPISIQILDPALVSHYTRCTVVSGFRQSDLALGGQGAPLVPLYHWLRTMSSLYRHLVPFAIHNIGGISNLTIVSRSLANVVGFDTGPGNALIDLAVESATNGQQFFDNNGLIAGQNLAKVNWKAIEHLGNHSYFRKQPPKSTGRELFNHEFLSKLEGRGSVRVANATAFTAHTMARAYRDFIFKVGKSLNAIFVAGGGAKNKTLLQLFSRELARLTRREILVTLLPAQYAPVAYLEAMAFARLGVEALCGNRISLSSVTGAHRDSFGANITSSVGRVLQIPPH